MTTRHQLTASRGLASLLLPALLCASSGALLAQDQAPRPMTAAGQSFSACYDPAVGALYLIKLPGLAEKCLKASHLEIVLRGVSPDDPTGATVPSGPAGGDLSGTYPNPGVARLQGTAMAATVPAPGQALFFAGGAWRPVTPAFNGDVTGGVSTTKVVKLQNQPVAATAPTAGQVLQWDATALAWTPSTPASGVTAHNQLSGLTSDDHPQYLLLNGVRTAFDGFALLGQSGNGVQPVLPAGDNPTLLWYPRKFAFRAGRFNSAVELADVNIGNGSVALGTSLLASGGGAVALGSGVSASGDNAVAMGFSTVASGRWSTAIGSFGTTASADNATAVGFNASASAQSATALGTFTQASGVESTALGSHTIASGDRSTAFGEQTHAVGGSATAFGVSTTAQGDYSTAFGFGSSAQANGSTAMGTGTFASGLFSTAMGNSSVASGSQSTAMGMGSTASGVNAVAMGTGATADQLASTALGRFTRASGIASTAMGDYSLALGFATTGAGYHSTASGWYSTAMGYWSAAIGQRSTALGDSTTASGVGSTAMGVHTVASGNYSTAMGAGASTNGMEGSFVWGDNTGTSTLTSTAANQFALRASGGIRLRTQADLATGCDLAASGGVWNCTSSKSQKTDFADVSGDALLTKVRDLPVQTWRYKGEDSTVRHMGPYAEDFRAAFQLGADSLTIGHIDLSGVTLAVTKALESRTRDLRSTLDAKDQEITRLREEVAELHRDRREMWRRLEALEQKSAPTPRPTPELRF